MIRSKQMEELRRLHSSLRNLGHSKEPSLEKHVMIALVSGETPKLKPPTAISKTARRKIVDERYSRSLTFSDVFASCNGYEGEMKQWNAHEKARRTAVSRYEKDAEKIMLKAMDQDADAAEISEQLHDAAERAGLKAITAPSFGDSADSD